MTLTPVYVEGYTGLGLRVYRGGPKDARAFVRDFTEIVQSIVDAAAKGESGA